MCFDNNEHQSDICHYKSNSVNNLFWQIFELYWEFEVFKSSLFWCQTILLFKKIPFMVTRKLMKSHEQNGSLLKRYSYFQIEELAVFIIVQCFYCRLVNFLMSSALLTWCHFVNIVNCRL